MRANMQRRSFLLGLGTFAVQAGAPPAARANPSEAAWRELRRRLNGALVMPGDKGYDALALPQNLRYKPLSVPQGIATVRTTEQVSLCIDWARHETIDPIVRSGGHCYAGFSTTTGLQIDMRAMNRIDNARSNKKLAEDEIVVGGGALNKDIYAALKAVDATITHGRCTAVGAAGFLLGGGIGFNMRRLGIGSDGMLATDIVLADSSAITASASGNSDLFWACRGGAGGNFGVNTAFKMKVHKAPSSLCVFNLTWTQKPDDVLPVLLETLRNATTDLGSKVSVTAPSPADRARGGDVHVALLGQLVGSKDALLSILRPVLRIAAPDDLKATDGRQGIYTMPYWPGQAFLEEEGKPAYYQERSSFVRGPMPAEKLKAALHWARNLPVQTKGPCEFKFFQTGGAVNALASGATAFVHRDSDWIFDIEINWLVEDPRETVDALHKWQDDFYTEMEDGKITSSYQNFADPSLKDNQWQTAYYGQNYSKLQRVKQQYDRDSFFRYKQSIQPG